MLFRSDAQRAPAMRPYGATDYGGDVHLTLESDDGAPSNANRGHGVSTTMPRLGVTGPVRGKGRARRRLDLGGEVDVRGGCDRGWHVACAAGVAFIAGIALALALVASSAGGGELSSCNYLARATGCRAGMRIARAKEMCPNLIVMPYEFERYSAVAIDVYRTLHELSPHVMGVSVDEAYVDVTGQIGRAHV